jgi:hypothetical protein
VQSKRKARRRMSRSGYVDDSENLNLYRATVRRSIQGRRGQAFLRELAREMDAMPERRLIAGDLVTESGECCAIGVVARARKVDCSQVDIDDPEAVGSLVGISSSMAAEIEWLNDEWDGVRWSGTRPVAESPEERWLRIRRWVEEQLS